MVNQTNPALCPAKPAKDTYSTKEIKENSNPLKVNDEGKKNNLNPENRPEDKKSISKMLISIVHFCRFLYKLIIKLRES